LDYCGAGAPLWIAPASAGKVYEDFELKGPSEPWAEDVERLTRRVKDLEKLVGNVDVQALALAVMRIEQKVDRLDRR
jgi:hypothetical protein